jgi:hypothetical protein
MKFFKVIFLFYTFNIPKNQDQFELRTLPLLDSEIT